MDTLCTYFDRAYLPRGLALYDSLVQHWGEFELYVLCLDDDTERALRQLALPRLHIVPLAELEAADPALAATRPTRSPIGYYLTCTAVLVRHVLARAADAPAVFYVDADLCFFSSPAPLLAEFAAGSIYIHAHRPAHPDWGAELGRYNVGLVAFRRDEQGRACVELWRERCLAWCELVAEADRFGDQKYLEEWPGRFDRVVVATHRGVGVGPWNLGDYRFSANAHGTVTVDGQSVIFFHFSLLKLAARGIVSTHTHLYVSHLPRLARRALYRPYVRTVVRKARLAATLGVHLASPFGSVPGGGASAARRPAWRRGLSLVRGLRAGSLLGVIGQRVL
ncbi:MAG: hypothetical protein ABI629_11970 [bacterium]